MTMLFQIILWVLACRTRAVLSIPEDALTFRSAAERFQNSVQQQTFQSVLLAIDERLRNLDNIYSMQLSDTLKSKMDLYHRKLESLDTKIMRLESMVMLNLDKISENISTKNYKDDVTRTQTQRKLDNVYDGVARRIDYMDRKFEVAMEKIQSKVDSTLQRLERMEEDMIQRNADIESELSETFAFLEDYKSSTTNSNMLLLNITDILKETVPNSPFLNVVNSTMYELVDTFNESVNKRFDSLESGAIKILNISEDTKEMLTYMRLEIKDDFNEYANKVADMNVDVWKRHDVADESLKTIEMVTNSTRTEVQNGLRALMLQIGKLPGKGIMNNDKTSLEALKKSVNLSLEKIITNQELFLESCHRVQMDEAQIESEISGMLGKLIDMLETKMTIVLKDLKNIDKSVKNHDSRIHRNLNQANTNIISLFEKTTRANDFTEKTLQDIKFDIHSLFAFIQDVLPRRNNTEDLLNSLSVNISNLIQLITSSNANTTEKWNQLAGHFSKNKLVDDEFIGKIKNATGTILHQRNLTETINQSLVNLKKITAELERTLHKGILYTNATNPPETIVNNSNQHAIRKNCTENYGEGLIDVRTGGMSCSDDNITNDDRTNGTKLQDVEEERHLNKTIFTIFGIPPAPPTTTQTTQGRSRDAKIKKKCPPNWVKFMGARYGHGSNDNCTNVKEETKLKRRLIKPKLASRFKDGDDEVTGSSRNDNDYEELIDSTTEMSTEVTSTESSTEITTITTKIYYDSQDLTVQGDSL